MTGNVPSPREDTSSTAKLFDKNRKGRKSFTYIMNIHQICVGKLCHLLQRDVCENIKHKLCLQPIWFAFP